ncbi:MAG TPA: DUF2309 domain-containing protein [Thiobacillaceae bacterium]|nr:DUF2309 domain-containing protein [Thiobacillaceae bacterium]HNU65093.1 DUF2309 domain-containing protein [Thiobacillaceae bacterium]
MGHAHPHTNGQDGSHALLHRLEQVLPAQAPIQDFVHHNTLHGFQHLHFRAALAAAEAATGNQGYETPEAFRAYFRQGRIDLSDLNAALDETPELAPDAPAVGHITRRQVFLAGLRFDLEPLPAAALRWRMTEGGALRRCHDDVPAATRLVLLTRQGGEEAMLTALWQACAAATRVAPAIESPPVHESEEAALLWDRHRVKHEAQARLDGLLARFGKDLSLRGLLMRLAGEDLMHALRPYLVRHLAAHLDLGLAAWRNPARARGFYAAWLDSARRDPYFGYCELTGWDTLLERLPEDAETCIPQELDRLGLPQTRRAAYLETLAKELPGWSGMFLWRHGHPGYGGETTPVHMSDYLAVRLVLERLYAQQIAATHFKTEVSLFALRGYLQRHPAELLVRLHLFAEDIDPPLPEWLQAQGHRLVWEACGRAGEEDDADWLAVARLILDSHPSPRVDTGREVAEDGPHQAVDPPHVQPFPHPRRRGEAWSLFLLCQHLGLHAGALAELGEQAPRALLACLAELTPERMGWVWLQAYERHYRQEILGALAANAGRGAWKTRDEPPVAQLMFCIDDREEGLRRYLEEGTPGVETLGAAAHFNVPHAWRGLDAEQAVALSPVVPSVVVPAHEVRELPLEGADGVGMYDRHVRRRRLRLDWKARLIQGTRLGWMTPAFMSLAAAPVTLGVLLGKAFMPATLGRLVERLRLGFDIPVVTRIGLSAPNDSPEAKPEARRLGFTDLEQADRVQALLRNTGLTHGFSPLVAIVGHGSHSLNNPHASAYSCGACAGRNSGPNARLVAAMANRPEVRALLRQRGIDIPETTWFIGAEHDTCDDIVTWYDEVMVPEALRPALGRLQQDMQAACLLHARERCRRFVSAPLELSPEAAWKHVTGRANDYSQARPELGHATNACAFFGRRAFSRGAFFDRRAFLVSYDPSQDPEGELLERHLVINGAVGAGISLEYYFSSANNERYGCGTKVMHNIVGLSGVMQGAASDLRTGLPRQMIEVHEAMRLLVVVEHRLDVLTAIYQRQPAVRELVDNEWVQLVAIDPDSGVLHRFLVGTGWVEWRPEGPAPATVPTSTDWVRGRREPLPPVLIEQGARAT